MRRPLVEVTQKRLNEVLAYDAETGVFTWSAGRRGVVAGSRAGSVDSNGYRYITVDKRWYLAQRLAWLLVHGELPERHLWFDDGDKDNCAIANLKYGDFDKSTSEGRSAYDKAHRQRNPQWHRRINLKRDFGITLEQYQALFVEQDGVCACCKKPETSERGGRRKWLAVDHDHSDNTVRGLLCSNCNQGLGRFGDSPVILRAAATYLEAHAAKPKTNVIPLAGRKIANQGGNTP